jgi:hypothetical protein
MYYEIKTQYNKLGEDGQPKKVTESFLVDALSCTEAEAIGITEVQPFSTDSFKVCNVRETKIAELFQRDVEGKWYACRLAMVVEADNGKEKRIPVLIYVRAVDVNDAEEFVMLQLKKSMADWVVVGVTETRIVDVFTK